MKNKKRETKKSGSLWPYAVIVGVIGVVAILALVLGGSRNNSETFIFIDEEGNMIEYIEDGIIYDSEGEEIGALTGDRVLDTEGNVVGQWSWSEQMRFFSMDTGVSFGVRGGAGGGGCVPYLEACTKKSICCGSYKCQGGACI